jgi:hypothetical protein
VKDLCVVVVAISQLYFGYRYIKKIRNKKADATLSTWVMFLAGAGPSFFSCGRAHNWDLRSGVLNTTDLIYISAILVAICFWGSRKPDETAQKKKEHWFFVWFRRVYVATACLVFLYGWVSGDMLGSNKSSQVLMMIAYVPMWVKFYIAQKNIESFFGWLPNIFNSTIALYPAIYEGNDLSVLYTCRSLTFSLLTVSIMVFFELKARNNHRS